VLRPTNWGDRCSNATDTGAAAALRRYRLTDFSACPTLRAGRNTEAGNVFAKYGVTVGMGLDEAGINEDRDMLQEMRLALRVHRTPGMDDDVPTCAQILKMASEDGAHTTPFGRGKRRLAGSGMAACERHREARLRDLRRLLICDHDRSQRLRSSRRLATKTVVLALSDLPKEREDRAVADSILSDGCIRCGSVRTSAGARVRP